jgi:hypothetical protein
MYEWVLQHDIDCLQNINTNCWYKKLPRCLDVYVLSSPKNLEYCVYFNNLTTKPFFDVYVVQVVKFDSYGVAP